LTAGDVGAVEVIVTIGVAVVKVNVPAADVDDAYCVLPA
jgi:hypothetical protein